jgi:hypothetical protein
LRSTSSSPASYHPHHHPCRRHLLPSGGHAAAPALVSSGPARSGVRWCWCWLVGGVGRGRRRRLIAIARVRMVCRVAVAFPPPSPCPHPSPSPAPLLFLLCRCVRHRHPAPLPCAPLPPSALCASSARDANPPLLSPMRRRSATAAAPPPPLLRHRRRSATAPPLPPLRHLRGRRCLLCTVVASLSAVWLMMASPLRGPSGAPYTGSPDWQWMIYLNAVAPAPGTLVLCMCH